MPARGQRSRRNQTRRYFRLQQARRNEQEERQQLQQQLQQRGDQIQLQRQQTQLQLQQMQLQQLQLMQQQLQRDLEVTLSSLRESNRRVEWLLVIIRRRNERGN